MHETGSTPVTGNTAPALVADSALSSAYFCYSRPLSAGIFFSPTATARRAITTRLPKPPTMSAQQQKKQRKNHRLDLLELSYPDKAKGQYPHACFPTVKAFCGHFDKRTEERGCASDLRSLSNAP